MLNRSKTAAGTAARRGFTLLELVIVLLILGILAAIAIPTFNLIQQNAVERAVTTSAGAIARNANAIAASDEASGGVVGTAQLWEAAGESYGFPTSGTGAITATTGWGNNGGTNDTQTATSGTGAPAGFANSAAVTAGDEYLKLTEVSGSITRCVVVWSNSGKAEVLVTTAGVTDILADAAC